MGPPVGMDSASVAEVCDVESGNKAKFDERVINVWSVPEHATRKNEPTPRSTAKLIGVIVSDESKR